MKQADFNLLRPLWLPYSFTENEDCTQTFKLWLTEGNYQFDHCPPDICLYCSDKEELLKCISLDAFRFITHSFQTVYEMEKSTAYDKLTSWRIIQTYYAAFFAAHATLRYFGRSFSHLEKGNIEFLKQRCLSEASYSPNIATSYYLIQYEPTKREITFRNHNDSHRDLWKCYFKLIKNLETDCLSIRAANDRKGQLVSFFTDLSDSITNRGQYPDGNWLSFMRNEVNYKSLHGAWYPFSKETPIFSRIISEVKDWKKGSYGARNPILAKNSFERYFLTSFSIIAFGASLASSYLELIDRKGKRTNAFNNIRNLII